jgi:hypothetical protein
MVVIHGDWTPRLGKCQGRCPKGAGKVDIGEVVRRTYVSNHVVTGAKHGAC